MTFVFEVVSNNPTIPTGVFVCDGIDIHTAVSYAYDAIHNWVHGQTATPSTWYWSYSDSGNWGAIYKPVDCESNPVTQPILSKFCLVVRPATVITNVANPHWS